MPAGVGSVLADLARAFSAAGARWYVFGAQAVIALGVPRVTADVDVTVEETAEGSHRLLEVLEAKFALRVTKNVDAFIATARVIPLIHRESMLPVDVVIAGPGLEMEILGRVHRRRIGRGPMIPFIAPADLLALKVLAGRPRDLEDVRALLRAKVKDLSIPSVRSTLRTLGRLLDDSTLLPSFDALVRQERGRSRRASPRRKRSRTRGG